MSNLRLVRAKAGLTNYYHQQVIRNPVLDIDSTLVDQMTNENLMGGVSQSTLLATAVHSGCLNAQATGYASIQGGWNDSKGLIKLDFIVQDTPVNVEYMHVIGYITNNSSMEGLSLDAIMTPVMSWRTHETITGTLDIANPTMTRTMMGGRTDYLMNDGSSMNKLVSLRPNDVIDYSIEKAAAQDIMNRMEDEGLNGMQPQITPGASSIDRVGVVTSKRGNVNPTNYAIDILKAGTGFQRDNNISSNMLDHAGENPTQFDNTFGQLGGMSYQASNSEPQLLRDDFFREMQDIMGMTHMRGFNGYTISDLSMAFENINDVLDLTLMDRTQFMAEDYSASTESLGTSQMEEFVSHEITMNIMDLMLKNDIGAISFRGSNCDHFGGDGNLANVVILPYNPSMLKDDDFMAGNKVEAFVEQLTNQIFAKLNGLRSNQLNPLRFDVTAELFGTCVINLQSVNDSNFGDGFSMGDAGMVPVGMQSRCFPTFALSNFSAVLGDTETAQVAGSNFFSNLEAYFK